MSAGPSLPPLPPSERLAALSPAERHGYLETLRGELYALASLIAEQTMRRAWGERSSYPPYGLVRSLFSQLRVVSVAPRPFEEGSIDDFRVLGRAYLDTVVFHLERELTAIRLGDQSAQLNRLDQMLELFRIDAGPAGQSRLRDPFSFLYGGLHFGTSVCVELVEVMTRMLGDAGVAAPDGKRGVLETSIRAPYQLAGLNIEDIPSVYGRLHGVRGADPWFSPDSFVINRKGGEPYRIDIRPELFRQAPHSESGPRYKTRGCPARSGESDPGGAGAIATLWRWSIELACATGVMGKP